MAVLGVFRQLKGILPALLGRNLPLHGKLPVRVDIDNDGIRGIRVVPVVPCLDACDLYGVRLFRRVMVHKQRLVRRFTVFCEGTGSIERTVLQRDGEGEDVNGVVIRPTLRAGV